MLRTIWKSPIMTPPLQGGNGNLLTTRISLMVIRGYSMTPFSLDVWPLKMRGILVWDGSKSGEYNTKDGYRLLIKKKLWSKSNLPLSLCWDKNCLPKVGLFTWISLQKKILIANRFTKMGFEGPSRCLLCEREEESAHQILLNCDFANDCWKWLIGKLGWVTTLPNNILNLFQT